MKDSNELIQEKINSSGLFNTLIGLGDDYNAINDKNKALDNYTKALKIAPFMASGYDMTAYCYLKISELVAYN